MTILARLLPPQLFLATSLNLHAHFNTNFYRSTLQNLYFYRKFAAKTEKLKNLKENSKKLKKVEEKPKKTSESPESKENPKKSEIKEKATKTTKKTRKLSTDIITTGSNSMRKVLCVAEKNDAAKSIANILTQPQRPVIRNGPAKYNKLYTLKTNILGQNCDVTFTSVSGHLMNLEFPSSMKNWTSVPISSCFTEQVILSVNHNMKDIERQLMAEARNADALIIWTDCDREGENIGAEIVKVCHAAKRSLRVYRARFSEITNRSVRAAIEHLVQMDQKVVEAVNCRMELDLRIGAAFTRLQTISIRQHAPQLVQQAIATDSIISYGSCQFPTLGFVVDRWMENAAFIPEPFWKLQGRDENKKVDFTWARVRLFDEDVVKMYHALCNENMRPTVKSVESKPTSRQRPYALDTIAMEKMASKKLRMTAKRAMTAAEKLYQKGFISYPRTETNQFPSSIDLTTLVNNHANNPEWGQFTQTILQQPNGPNPRNGRKSDAAHPPIHPLKDATKSDITNIDEWVIYELVTRHFLACVSRDAKGDETKVIVGLNGEEFWASGLTVTDEGYLKVYKYDKWTTKQIPFYAQNEFLPNFSVRIGVGQTTAPPLLTESDLIALMDKHGIGTDATHAEHIDKIKTRTYVQMNRENRFEPTFLGLALVDCYQRMGRPEFSKPNLRADLEKELVRITEGTRTKDLVLRDQLQIYRQIFDYAERNINVLSDSIRVCHNRIRN